MSEPESPAEGQDQELEALVEEAKNLALELRARGRQVPLFPVRLEALIDFLFPDGTPERNGFELFFRRRHVVLLTEVVAKTNRDDLLRGVNGAVPPFTPEL